MDDFFIARALHIVSVILWAGGVGFVTSVATPAIRATQAPADRLAAFHQFERRFVWQARLWVLLAGASGLWMTWRGDLWFRFRDPQYWWMHAMLGLWLIFMIMLFIIEPFFLQRRLSTSAAPARDFERLSAMHWLLLTALVITIAGSALGSHGVLG